ncbi:MAG: FAD-binding oxidoreductase [Thermoleophilia bacterium]|nr:FAD-binding oxidoreductase [Thermoleophilia bacterium]
MTPPYWLEDEPPPRRATRLTEAPEVVIVGGGVTGCACALALAHAGVRVRLQEAREIASGASGRNAGFALRGGAMPYDEARRRLGREQARALWLLSERALDRLADLAGDAFAPTGSLRLAADEGERGALLAEYTALEEDGFTAEWRDDLAPPLASRFHGALSHPGDGSLHPARWVRRLAALAAGAGAELREHARVESLHELGEVDVVVATDGYSGGLVPELDAVVRAARGQLVATEPLARRVFACPHYARHGYDYWQQTPDGRLVVGGWRDASLDTEFTTEEAVTPLIQQSIERFIRELIGEAPAITHRWAGIFGITPDRMPLVGRLPGRERVWVALGYSGHGNVLGLACGELVADALLGRERPELGLFDPARLLTRAD